MQDIFVYIKTYFLHTISRFNERKLFLFKPLQFLRNIFIFRTEFEKFLIENETIVMSGKFFFCTNSCKLSILNIDRSVLVPSLPLGFSEIYVDSGVQKAKITRTHSRSSVEF